MPLNDYNGEPGCRTATEVNQIFRHNWDPTSYWQCGSKGEPAQAKRCAPNKLYLDEVKQCVNWTDWHWTEPEEPPSRPNSRIYETKKIGKKIK